MATTEPSHHPYFTDLYTFDWSTLSFREPLVSVLAVGLCLIGGVLAGHPGVGLIAGGGAMTVGFGITQKIGDSRLWPMIAAVAVMCLSTFIGMIAGHHGYALVLSATLWGLNYGLLTSLAPGIAWVGQQAAVNLFVASAFPASPHDALLRAFVILCGGTLQIVILSIFLHLLPELHSHLKSLPHATSESISYLLTAAPHDDHPHTRLHAVTHHLPNLPGLPTWGYGIRMALTVLASAEIYRRLNMQSGYWVPMTALLVQKPAFAETLNRALMRIGGTVVGAGLVTFLLVHTQPEPLFLAIFATLFAFSAYCFNAVNYGLFSLALTGYIVFLLSLNTLPGPVIAHRRVACTITGGLIALVFHLDSLRRKRAVLPDGSESREQNLTPTNGRPAR